MKRRARGYSLLELVVALALMALIAAFAVNSLALARETSGRSLLHSSMSNKLSGAHNRLREWIERSVPVDSGRSDTLSYPPLQGRADELTFSTSLSPDGTRDVLSRVRVAFDASLGALVVDQALDTNDRAVPDRGAGRTVLIDGLAEARFNYLPDSANAQWQSQWSDMDSLPEAVRVQLQWRAPNLGPIPDLIARPLVDSDAWCDFDPVSRSCRAQRSRR